MNYGYGKKIDLSIDEIRNKLEQELVKEGFGILTEIDVKKKFKEKIDVDYNPYIILGICNPKYAYEALQVDIEVGLLLPCNIIIYEKNGDNYISVLKPTSAMAIIENDEINKVAEKAEKALLKIIDNI